jgi:hypothetical protein
MCRLTLVALMFGALTASSVSSDPATPDGGDRPRPQADAAGRTGEVGHEEVPVPPPASPVQRASQPRSPRAIVLRGPFRSVQVNVDAGQNNIVGDAANEPSLAIDPTDPDRIVIGWRQFDTVVSSFRQAGYAYSGDGGATWTFPGVLQPGQFRSDPVLAADSAGNFYYYSLSSTTTAEYFVSSDGGAQWTGPLSSPGGDKNWQTIDLSGGMGSDHVYAIWNPQFTCCGPGTDFTRSTTAATSFEGPYVMPQPPKWGTLDVGPDGELYVVGATLDQSSHLILRSDNADNALQTPTFSLAANVDLGGVTLAGGPPNPGGLLGQVWVAVDRSNGATRGNVYVLASVDPPGADPLDVHLIRSSDGGQTWSPPVAVNDNAGSGSFQWFGTLSIAPDGRLDAVWNDTLGGAATSSELRYAYSTDAGVTWSAGLPVSPAYNSTQGHPMQNKMGDYYHMISSAADAAVAWAATFNAEQDVYFLRVGDCNTNGMHDSADLASLSLDCNANGIPDECEDDCNANGIADGCDITAGTSFDCDGNTVLDECELVDGTAQDCNGNGLLDKCDVTFDLESSQGFTVGAVDDTATRGQWIQVDPFGTAAQPEDDHTPSGTQCFVTGQGLPGGATTFNEVNGGKTTLFSPLLDVSAFGNPWIGYWRWYSNDAGAAPHEDVFVVDVTGDGGQSWVNVETVGPTGSETSGGWFYHAFRVADLVAPSDSVQLRFVAADLFADSVVEAAIDDLVVTDCPSCALAAPGEVADLSLALATPTVAEFSWDAVADAERYDVYRGTLRDASDLACFLPDVAATLASDDGLVPALGEVLFFAVTAENCAGESTLGPGRLAGTPCP